MLKKSGLYSVHNGEPRRRGIINNISTLALRADESLEKLTLSSQPQSCNQTLMSPELKNDLVNIYFI